MSYRYRQGVAILDPLSSGRGRLTAAGQRAAKAASKSACSIRNVAVSTAPRPAAGKLLTGMLHCHRRDRKGRKRQCADAIC